jgi:hypothetical protein
VPCINQTVFFNTIAKVQRFFDIRKKNYKKVQKKCKKVVFFLENIPIELSFFQDKPRRKCNQWNGFS